MNNKIITLILVAALGLTGCNDAGYQEIDNAIFIDNAMGISGIDTYIVDGTRLAYLNIRTAKALNEDVRVEIAIDEDYLEYYNEKNNTSYQLLPPEFYTIETYSGVLKAGQTTVSFEVELNELSNELNKTGFVYVLPLKLSKAEGGPQILETARNYLFAVSPIPYADVPIFGKTGMARLYLAENMVADEMTFEFLMCYVSSSISTGNNGCPFLFYNIADGANPGAINNGIYTRWGDAGRPATQWSGQIKQMRFDFPEDKQFVPWKWYHVAFVLADKTYTIYVDGEPVVQVATTAEYDFLINKDDIQICENLNMDVMKCQLRLWNTARTPEQLKNNMYAVQTDTPGLVGYWKLNEAAGSVFVDATGNNPDGKFDGTARWQLDERIETGR